MKRLSSWTMVLTVSRGGLLFRTILRRLFLLIVRPFVIPKLLLSTVVKMANDTVSLLGISVLYFGAYSIDEPTCPAATE
jgi:hypothetical protein